MKANLLINGVVLYAKDTIKPKVIALLNQILSVNQEYRAIHMTAFEHLTGIGLNPNTNIYIIIYSSQHKLTSLI